jgi:hypothetical protein
MSVAFRLPPSMVRLLLLAKLVLPPTLMLEPFQVPWVRVVLVVSVWVVTPPLIVKP